MKSTRRGVISKRQTRWGWILIMPLTLGLSIWVVFPMGLSLVTSLTHWDMISPPTFVGLQNYIRLFSGDELFLRSVKVTLYYTVLSVPLQLATAFFVSMLLNSDVKGLGIFRTIYYLPSLIPIVVTSIMWLWLYNEQYGLLNAMFSGLGLGKVGWISNPKLVIPSLVAMSIWGVGNVVVIFLAGLQGIPLSLIEAVKIDGGNAYHAFRHVTLPLMSPVILYNMIVSIIKSLQLFTEPYIMTGGGPVNSSLSFVLNIYNNAFKYSKMGEANALAWMLFLLTLILSVVIFKTSAKWTFYGGDR